MRIKQARRMLATALTGAILLNSAVLGAAAFTDMPDNWSTEAVQAAVNNGLLQGVDGKIMPNEPLTRAQMAAIVNRAFGATEQANISEYKDVPQEDWYYADMAKAVQMKTFGGIDEMLMPKELITREQAFAVMARALQLPSGDTASLDSFTDKAVVAEWAAPAVAAMVKIGLVTGQGGNLAPKEIITRSQFAQLMHNCIKTYIKTSGTATKVGEGSVMVNAADSVIKDQHIKGDLIIGDGVGDADVTIENVKVDGRIVVRGGGVNSIKLLGTTAAQQLVVSRVNNRVRVFSADGTKIDAMHVVDGKDNVIVEGKIGTLTIDATVPVIVQNAKVETVALTAKNAAVTVDKVSTVSLVEAKAEAPVITVAGTVGTVTADEKATGAVINTQSTAKITTVNAAASGMQISGNGKVEKANVTANDVKVNTSGTTTRVESGVTGTTSNGNDIKGGSTVTTTPDKPQMPSDGNSSGGGNTDNRAAFPATYLIVNGAVESGKPYSFAGDTSYRPASIEKERAFISIAAAVAAARKNDTIYVTAGAYETYAQIEKPIKLIGAGSDLVTLTAPENGLCNLVLGTLKPSPYGKDISGTVVSGMTLIAPAKKANTLDTMAIYLTGKGSEGNEVVIRDCVFKGAPTLAEADQHVGISTPYSTLLGHVKITNNTFTNMKYAMYFSSLKNAQISENTIDGTRYNAINIAADSKTYPASDISISKNKLSNISYQNFDDAVFSSGIYIGPNSDETVTVAQDNVISMLNEKLPVFFAEKPELGLKSVFVSASGNDENSGATDKEPVNTIEKATELLATTGTVTVMGEVTAPPSNGLYSIGLGKSITYVGKDETAKLIFNEDVSFEGDTTFRDIKLDFTKETHYAFANGHKFTFDTGVTTKPLETKYERKYLYLYGGGFNRDVDSTDVVIKSGRIHNLFGGGRSTDSVATANVSGDTNITITGGYVDDAIVGGGHTSTGLSKGTSAEVVGSTNISASGSFNMGWYSSNDSLNEGTIYGGGWALSSDGDTTVSETNIVLKDLKNFNASVFGGGHGQEANSKAQVIKSNITIENVTTSGSAIGGGQVYNNGNGVDVDTANINIKNSTIAEVLGGAWVGSGRNATTTNVFITLDNVRMKGVDSKGNVTSGAFYAGGSGDSKKSISTVVNAEVSILNNIYFAESAVAATTDEIRDNIHMFGRVAGGQDKQEITGEKTLLVDGAALTEETEPTI